MPRPSDNFWKYIATNRDAWLRFASIHGQERNSPDSGEQRMATARVEQIIRHFRENGLKLLLEHPANVRDLISLTPTPLRDRLDFSRMRVDPTSYIAADYRHLASDLVLQVPFRAGRGRHSITVYILIEHQSEADPLMRLRVLDYVVQIYKRQVRDWLARHPSLKGFRLAPVLPVVLYTGTSSWPGLPRLEELVEQGKKFVDLLPEIEPLFVNLPGLAAATLEGAGPLGWVLELMQQRQARPQAFQELLRRVVARLEAMPARERTRWLELLSYLQALVYHDRERAEREGLREVIVASVRTDKRREVETMTQTIADALREEGRQEGRNEGRQEGELRTRQEILVRQLRNRFGKLPRATERVIRATDDIPRLDGWLDRVLTAATLQDLDIRPRN
jgi:predicted transposase YdaD